MSSINKVIIIGNVGRDPEVKSTKGGKSVCDLSIATSSKRGGEEKTDWHRVTCWDKTADIVGRYVTKGSQVAIEGRLTYESWEKDGQKHTRAVIVCEQLTLMGGGGKRDGAPMVDLQLGRRPTMSPKPYDSGDGRGSSVPDDDDIPF